MSNVLSLLHRSIREESDPLNILTFPTHERYESILAKTGHRFWSCQTTEAKRWVESYAPVPNNYTLIEEDLTPDITIDVILVHAKQTRQYDIARSMSASYSIPIVVMNHTLPHAHLGEMQINAMRARRGHINVYVSEYAKNAWGEVGDNVFVIEHGMDTELFSPHPEYHRTPQIFAAVNDWINRDFECGFTLWRQVTEGMRCFVLGDTPGLSRPARSVDELVFAYRTSSIFINTAVNSTFPLALLEAMACGCAVVSVATPVIASFIENRVNGYATNDPQEMRAILQRLIDDEGMANKIGMNGRQTVLDKFGLDRHLQEWSSILEKSSRIPYVGVPQ